MASVSPDMRLGHSFGNDDDPPSPSAVSRPIPIPGAGYQQAWESNDYGASPANFGAYTPSYVGSFGSQQESAWGDREATAAAYSVGASGDLFDDSKYEPEGYGTPYLMEDQSGFATLSGGGQNLGNNDSLFPAQDIHVGFHDVDPRQFSPRPGEVFATGSPGSSIGIGEATGPRSRASSMSSNPGAQSSPFLPPNEFPGQPLHDHFTKLSFNNQSLDPWGRQSMTSPPRDLSSPSQKPLSPPTLFIPPEPPAPTLQPEEQPAINLVPATPVSGGGAGGAIQLPFQQMLANLNRQRAQGGLAFGRGNPNAATAPALPPVTSFATNLGDSSAHTNQDAMNWTSLISASGQSQGTAPSALPQQARVYHHGYNVPLPDYNNPSTQQRPSLAMQMSNTNTLPHLPHQSQSDSSIPSTSGINLPPFSSPQSHNIASFSETSLLTAPSLTRNRSKSDTSTRPPVWLDPASSTSTSLSSMSNELDPASSSFNFTLTPAMQRSSLNNNMGSLFAASTDLNDMTLGLGDVASVRRSNSDGGRSHKRSVKSEDFTSLRTPRLVPTSSADFIRSVTAADGSLAPIDPRSPPLGGPGPQRRRGSGSGHERNSSLSSLRATPYQRPSPHTSPGGSPHHSPTGGQQPLPSEQQAAYMRVERPLVTTPATKTASANRRRAEASFTCPVPGCGSTFTRHFNLRGHLRSHNEERPFKCKWPGCEKGFARQHDCKRHEALHLNIRPYTCEGCQKTFARMDALNRHLRSEGGVDCQKLHQAAEGSPNSNTSDLLSGSSSVPQTTGMMKIEQESSPWTASGTVVL